MASSSSYFLPNESSSFEDLKKSTIQRLLWCPRPEIVLLLVPLALRSYHDVLSQAYQSAHTAFTLTFLDKYAILNLELAEIREVAKNRVESNAPRQKEPKTERCMAMELVLKGHYSMVSYPNDIEMYLIALAESWIRQGSSPLQYACRSIRDNATMVTASIRLDVSALQYASPRLRNDIAIVQG